VFISLKYPLYPVWAGVFFAISKPMEWALNRSQLVSLAFLLIATTGCMNQVGGSGYPVQVINALALTDSQKAFNDTLFPTLIAQCSQCHGLVQGPLFAIKNRPGPSHDEVIASHLVDFENRPNSKIVMRVREGHNCWSADCNEDADTVLAAITQWAKRIDPSSVPSGDLTSEVLIPADATTPTLCNASTGIPVSFNLRDIDSRFPEPSRFQVRIRVASEESYEICDPRIITSAAIHIADVKIYINGSSVVNQSAYRLIDTTTSASPTAIETPLHAPGGPVVSPGAVLIPIRSGLGVDTIAFEFLTLTQ